MKYLLTALMLLTGVCCMAKDELLTAPPRAANHTDENTRH